MRLAWLATAAHDVPPPEAHLAFRVRRLRGLARTRLAGVRVFGPEQQERALKRPLLSRISGCAGACSGVSSLAPLFACGDERGSETAC